MHAEEGGGLAGLRKRNWRSKVMSREEVEALIARMKLRPVAGDSVGKPHHQLLRSIHARLQWLSCYHAGLEHSGVMRPEFGLSHLSSVPALRPSATPRHFHLRRAPKTTMMSLSLAAAMLAAKPAQLPPGLEQEPHSSRHRWTT